MQGKDLFFILLFLGIGIWQIYAGVKRYLKSPLYKKYNPQTTGEIVSYEKRRRGKGYAYFPTVDFYTDNERLAFESSSPSFFKPKIGARVKVKFDAQDPHNADVNNMRTYLAPFGLIISGLIITALGVAVFFIEQSA